MLRVNINKTKMMISSGKANKVRKEGRFPCIVCRKVQAVISFSASFASVGCRVHAVVLEVY